MNLYLKIQLQIIEKIELKPCVKKSCSFFENCSIKETPDLCTISIYFE